MFLKYALLLAKSILLPAMQEYAAKTPNKIDDVVVALLSQILDDPAFLDFMKAKM